MRKFRRGPRRIYASRNLQTRIRGLAILGLASALGSVVFAAIGSPTHLEVHGLIMTAWALIPPAWFAFEYFVVFDNWKKPTAVQEFKHVETLTSKIWAGVLALLLAVYTSREDISFCAQDVTVTDVAAVVGGLLGIIVCILILIGPEIWVSTSEKSES